MAAESNISIVVDNVAMVPKFQFFSCDKNLFKSVFVKKHLSAIFVYIYIYNKR